MSVRTSPTGRPTRSCSRPRRPGGRPDGARRSSVPAGEPGPVLPGRPLCDGGCPQPPLRGPGARPAGRAVHRDGGPLHGGGGGDLPPAPPTRARGGRPVTGRDLDRREAVRRAYSAAARDPGGDHPFAVGRDLAIGVGYPADLLDRMPDASV